MVSTSVSVLAAAALAVGGFLIAPTAANAAADASCRTIPVDVDRVLHSDAARAEFGVDGTGVKVGIISDSYDQVHTLSSAAQNVADGLLPGPGNPCGYTTPVTYTDMPFVDGAISPTATDEGRAMAQMVHGVAPGAQLFFASAGVEVEDVPGAIQTLIDQGVDIIVDDVLGNTETTFQESLTSAAVNAAVAQGITYLSAAGNNTLVAQAPRTGQEATPIGAYETAAYRPGECPPLLIPAIEAEMGTSTGYDCHVFDADAVIPGQAGYTTLPRAAIRTAGQTVVQIPIMMQWAEPMGGSKARFGLGVQIEGEGTGVLVPPAGTPGQLRGLDFDLTGKQTGDDAIDETELQISLVRYTDGTPETEITRPIGFMFQTDGLQFLQSADHWRSSGDDTIGRTINGHNGAASAISVAATGAFDEERVDTFSSLGPVRYYLSPENTAGTATFSPVPTELHKPNILSVDGARQNVISGPATGEPGVFLFYGTSAASPTAAAVAALALQLDPTLTPDEVHALIARTATLIPSPYPGIAAADSVGAGLISPSALLAAVTADLPTPVQPADRPVLAASGGSDVTGVAVLGALLLATGAAFALRRRATR